LPEANGQAPPADLLVESAPAKVNLTLEIKGKRADGYHELESLVLFADFGDRLEFHPHEPASLSLNGPFASELEAGGNLVERAAAAFARHIGAETRGAFQLNKQLPVAAGLGGGSSDAAAALRLLRRAHGVPESVTDLLPLARELGADTSCCLLARAALMSGLGERLRPLAPVTPIPALLVNPLRPLATSDVFRALAAPMLKGTPAPSLAPALTSTEDVFAYALARRNDLEVPAMALLPVIGEILAALTAAPGSLLTRMSGSGPTCFALFAKMEEAEAAAAAITRREPNWWIRPVRLS
jgi:4-diphosphocytidyl-2-C-methyl-D-erythritol kinase